MTFESTLPDGQEDIPDAIGSDEAKVERSLADDIGALIDDSKTYAEAELAYQKSRLTFAANRGKAGVGFLLAALAFLHLALIGLVIGSIISLMPLIGPFGATLAVVGGLLVAMAIFLFFAKGKFAELAKTFDETRP